MLLGFTCFSPSLTPSQNLVNQNFQPVLRDEETKAQRDWSCQDTVKQLVLFGVEREPRAHMLVATLLW